MVFVDSPGIAWPYKDDQYSGDLHVAVFISLKTKSIQVRVFLLSCVCLRSSLNMATEILIFSHFLGTDIATFTEKPEQ